MLIKKTLRLIILFLLNPVYLIASLTPKDENIWLFSAWNGKKFLDSPKYVFKYLLSNNGAICAIWVAKDKTLYNEMVAQGFPVAYAYSLRGLYLQMRAGIVVFTHSVEWDFVASFVGYTTKRVQTWHGIPLKKIGYDNKKDGNQRLKELIRLIILPFTTVRLDLVIAASEVDKAHLQSAFGVTSNKVRVTGYPRNDSLVGKTPNGSHDNNRIKRIIYMPTFRGNVGSEFKLLIASGFDFKKVDALLKDLNLELYIKLHPVQVFSKEDTEQIAKSSCIKAILNHGDIYEHLHNYDVLITDFSGIFFDFLITGKPIIMAPINMDTYLHEDRELYYNYEAICPDTPCMHWDEVLNKIIDVCKEDYLQSNRYTALQKKFHTYLDAMSSRRVVRELASIT